MRTIEYDRQSAVAYARQWAYKRNPNFYNFDSVGGDCTNFASQCLYAGKAEMNFTPVTGWYYRSSYSRTASWTGVEYLYNFLIQNNGIGPFAREQSLDSLELGDLIQLGHATGDFYHTPIIVGFSGNEILVAAHTFDAYAKPLSEYYYAIARGIHVLGVRTEQ